MKKFIFIFSVFMALFLFQGIVYADSPLTSTQFSKAYQDISIVKKASDLGKVTSTIANYLYDPKNPIDIKAAVINAMSWDIDGKTNAKIYCKLMYKKSLEDINVNKLSGDQQFCIGYMLALDDYFHTDTALKYLKSAEKKLHGSFTVSIIRALTEEMSLDGNEWTAIEKVLNNSKVSIDMRQDAINIILDYMALYSNGKSIISEKNNIIIQNGETQTIHLYGTTAFNEEIPYQIVSHSEYACVALCTDEYNVFCLKLTGLKNGSSSITIKNQDGLTLTVNFDVVSADTYDKLKHTIAMYVGNNNAFIDRKRILMDKKLVPYETDNVVYIPLEFASKAIGGAIQYDKKKGTSTLTYAGKTIKFINNKKDYSVNGKSLKLESKIIYKSQKQFISAQDFTEITKLRYVYDNGLIVLADQSEEINNIDDDFILDEIAWVVTQGELNMPFPTSISYNGKYGYEDSKGNVVIKPIYELAYDFNDGLASIVILDDAGNRKYGVIDTKGNYIAMPEYAWAGSYSNGLIPVMKDGMVGYLDGEGKIAIPLKYRKAGNFNSGLAPVLNEEGTKWGYINVNGSMVVPYSYTDCTEFMEGVACVQINGKWGYINTKGEYIIPAEYDSANVFCYGQALVEINGENYLINISDLFIIHYNNGDCSFGKHKGEYLNGKGIYTSKSGCQFTGDFVKGYFHGKGMYTWTNGDKYIGDWVYDNNQGNGVYTWYDGTQYIGNFEYGKMDGKGTMINPDGSVIEGYWEDGIYQEEEYKS